MGADRQKTGKKPETASDMWRRMEQSGLDNALKKLATNKSELTVISSISSDDAANINSVMVEMCEMLNSVRLAYVENEKDIFDSDEHEKRYLTSTCPTIIKMWSHYSIFASEFACTFVEKSWINSSEHRELLVSVKEVAACAIKLLVMSVNMADYHSLDDADILHKAAVDESVGVSKCLTDVLTKIVDLGDSHPAIDTLMYLVGWMLYGLNHTSNKVIKVGIEAKAPEATFEEFDPITDNITTLLKLLQASWGEDAQPEAETAPTQPTKKQSKDTKTSEPAPEDEKKRPKEFYIDVIQKLTNAYTKFSDNAWETQRLPMLKGRSGVTLRYRMECYDQIGKLSVDSCLMSERKAILNDLKLTDDHELQSDLFIIGPEALNSTCEVIIQFPLLPDGPTGRPPIYLSVRTDGKWEDTPAPDMIDVGGVQTVVFRTKTCDAFTAIALTPPDEMQVGPQGANYVSENSSRVEVFVPQGCFESEATLALKVTRFNKENYSYPFVGIEAASPAVNIVCKSGDVEMKKHVTVQLPLEEDTDEDKDSELVVVRYSDKVVHVLDSKQITVRSTGRQGIFTIDIKGFWCVAILRIRRIFLNMRESVKKEFMVGFDKRVPCNILTYIDDMSRCEEAQVFTMELLDRQNAGIEADAKRTSGIIEVKKSRSKDIFLKRGDMIAVQVDGQMRLTEAMTEDQQTLCFLPGCNNSLSMATELKRDPEKLPDAMVFYTSKQDDAMVHSVAIMTRDLSELPTDEITARTGLNANTSDSKKDKEREEAAANILKMESLMSLARELTFEEGKTLGEQLGVKADTIKQIKDSSEKDPVGANFQILCSWRGRFARATMADFLISSLKAVGKVSYADLVIEVRKNNRGLSREDFEQKRPKRKSAM